MTMWMIFSFAKTNGSGGRPAIEKRGARLLNATEIDRQVTAIYNDCWKTYREYTKTHNMRQFNKRVTELKAKYPNMQRFVRDILFAFVPVINSLHAEYMTANGAKKPD